MEIAGKSLTQGHKALPAPRAGENVSRKARTVNAFIKTLFLVCIAANFLIINKYNICLSTIGQRVTYNFLMV